MKKNKFIIGLILFVLITSTVSVSATYTLPRNENRENTVRGHPFIDPSICLTKNYLPILQKALSSLNEGCFRIFLQEVIKKIQSKGSINSEDIQDIILQSQLSIDRVYFCKFIRTNEVGISGTLNPGFCNHMFRSFYYGGILHWRADRDLYYGRPQISISIGHDMLTYTHEGLSIGYFGYGWYSWGIFAGQVEMTFDLSGLGAIIIIAI